MLSSSIGMLGRMIGLQLLAGLLLAPHVLADLVPNADMLDGAWGTQSACNGCSYVKGRVIERTQEEVKN